MKIFEARENSYVVPYFQQYINPKIQGPPNEGSLSGYPRFVLCLHITTTTTGKQNIHYDANDVHTINEGEYVNLISRTSLKIK